VNDLTKAVLSRLRELHGHADRIEALLDADLTAPAPRRGHCPGRSPVYS
jgi:hypothetical protein